MTYNVVTEAITHGLAVLLLDPNRILRSRLKQEY